MTQDHFIKSFCKKVTEDAVVFQAEEVTLTIGQAFDLAYKKFLESGGKDVETRKQIGTLQKRVRFNCWTSDCSFIWDRD